MVYEAHEELAEHLPRVCRPLDNNHLLCFWPASAEFGELLTLASTGRPAFLRAAPAALAAAFRTARLGTPDLSALLCSPHGRRLRCPRKQVTQLPICLVLVLSLCQDAHGLQQEAAVCIDM